MALIWSISILIFLIKCQICASGKCIIARSTTGSPKTLLTTSNLTSKKYWIHIGEDLGQLEIKIEVKNTWSFSPSYVVDESLILTGEDIASGQQNGSDWVVLSLKIFEKVRLIGQDKLILRVNINKTSFDLDASLWWTKYSFRKFLIYGIGQIELYEECTLSKAMDNEQTTAVSNATDNGQTTDDSDDDMNYKLNLLRSEQIRSIVTLTIAVTSLILIVVGIAVIIIRRRRKKKVSPQLSEKETEKNDDSNHYDSLENILRNSSENRRLELPPPLPVLDIPLHHNSESFSPSEAKYGSTKDSSGKYFPYGGNSFPTKEEDNHYMAMSGKSSNNNSS